MSNGSPTVRRRRLGAQLRDLRKTSGSNVEEIAEAFGVTPSTIYRMELGRVGVKARDVGLFAKLYNVQDEDLIKELTSLARDGNKRGWWAKYSDTISPPYATYIGLEEETTRLHIYDGLIINGLLQTKDYARATFDFASVRNREQAERRIELRMERQNRVKGKQLQLWNILDEAAIRRVIGGPTVMRQQLEHLLNLAALQNTTIQILPFGAGVYPGMLGSFTIMEFGPSGDPDEPEYKHPDVVYIEGHTADVYEEENVTPFRRVLEDLQKAALSAEETMTMIRGAIDNLS
ncbi:helix-turn-helix domain-containing protein [Stackebrandtia soli]|uniref:helix-turn-helix domain-containing protein n=1 Tax=Stackebrandtia soli TaxID=1892856 RepID=UPI0039EA108E